MPISDVQLCACLAGDIKPPINFKKHMPRFLPPATPDAISESLVGESRVDIFGKNVPVIKSNRREPFMWKLSYKLNNPEYQKVQAEVERRRLLQQQQERQHPPAVAVSARRSIVH